MVLALNYMKGESVGIVGESGSGKTSLMLAILKLINSEGKILINNKNINQLDKQKILNLRKEIQIVFQDPFSSLSPRMNIEEIICEGLDVHYPDISKTIRKTRLKNVLTQSRLKLF